MENRTLHIEVSRPEAALAEFVDVFKRAEAGETVEPREAVGFEDMAKLVATLTPKRLELIERLRASGPVSAYALARDLKRHYSTVYKDLTTLRRLGLVERDENKQVFVPWDTIHIELQLAA